MVKVNSGAFVYGMGNKRQPQRGMAAHVNVVVDGENSSEGWGGVRVAQRANVLIVRVINKERRLCSLPVIMVIIEFQEYLPIAENGSFLNVL